MRLETLRKGEAKPVSPEEKAEADRLWLQWGRRAKARKKICMEIWAMVSEELPEGMTREELWVSLSFSCGLLPVPCIHPSWLLDVWG